MSRETQLNRGDAWALLEEFTSSASLKKHALGVEAAMRWYAKEHFKLSPEEIEKWGITGLLHDFDYERWPELSREGHPFKGNAILAERGYPEDVREAIMGHANYSGVSRVTDMAITLFAVDELSGLVTAAALVRPDKSLLQLEPSSVAKRMKDKAFAKGCSRDDIVQGAKELGMDLQAHIANVVQALKDAARELGLSGAAISQSQASPSA